jgi:hypothetical protein
MACTRRRSWVSGWRSSVLQHFGVASGRRTPLCVRTTLGDSKAGESAEGGDGPPNEQPRGDDSETHAH